MPFKQKVPMNQLMHGPSRDLSMSVEATISVQQFVQRLMANGLLSQDELGALLARLPARLKRNAWEIGLELVRQGKLTRYQLMMLFQEKSPRLVLGNYVILDRLGAGGMGIVFKAQHRRMRRLVALKVLTPVITRSMAAVRRFQREVEAAAQLSHPNIVAAYDAAEVAGTHFLVMEYVVGRDLSRLVQEQGPLPAAQAIFCVLQAARGLEHAHAQGVIHRDIKPSNLLLDDRGTVKILDMGLARVADHEKEAPAEPELTESGMVMGTCEYMAPEQAANSHAADSRADIYSLGCTLCYLINGRPPYKGSNAIETLLAHREQPIPHLGGGERTVSPSLERVYQRMLAKTPGLRYQSMHEVVVALEGLAGCQALVQPHYNRPLRPGRSFIRIAQRGKWTAAIALIAILGAALVFLSSQGRKADSQAKLSLVGATGNRGLPKQSVVVATYAKKEASPEAPEKAATLAGMSPAQQAAHVLALLEARNPGFDGKGAYEVENGEVAALAFRTDHVADISPVHGLARLRRLNCSGSTTNQGKLRGLEPLRGLPLTELICSFNPQLRDLSPLTGMPLQTLDCANTGVGDLAVLTGMPLTLVHCHDTEVRDLTPLRQAPLQKLRFDLRVGQDIEVLRSSKTLTKINGLDPAEFWKQHRRLAE
jgi:predicted Ser/Thr protein kinase